MEMKCLFETREYSTGASVHRSGEASSGYSAVLQAGLELPATQECRATLKATREGWCGLTGQGRGPCM